jgi:2-polyprenyl-3-methyl-5-hydroxy-6-metoxy-1,4-benzoquinol methylase
MVLSGRFADLTVIEASTEAVNIARKRVSPNVKFVNSLIESFEVANKFSSIFMINTLEHMDDAQAVLTQVGKWLDETGKLYILVPNADAASRQIAVYMGLIDSNNAVTTPEWNHGHRRTYSFDTLERDVTQSGLRVVVRGGLIFKALANFQFDAALEAGIINQQYVEACYKLGGIYPTLCASIFVVAQR